MPHHPATIAFYSQSVSIKYYFDGVSLLGSYAMVSAIKVALQFATTFIKEKNE
jgi:hypothetical protein